MVEDTRMRSIEQLLIIPVAKSVEYISDYHARGRLAGETLGVLK